MANHCSKHLLSDRHEVPGKDRVLELIRGLDVDTNGEHFLSVNSLVSTVDKSGGVLLEHPYLWNSPGVSASYTFISKALTFPCFILLLSFHAFLFLLPFLPYI